MVNPKMAARPIALFALFGCFFSATVGCGGIRTNTAPANSVSGVVRFGGKIVNYGSVAFIDDQGNQSKSVIKSDGRYSIFKPPLGKVRIVVRTGAPPTPMGAPDGPAMEPPPKIERIELPAEYTDPDKTKLTYTVTPGQNEFNIDLSAHPEGKETRK